MSTSATLAPLPDFERIYQDAAGDRSRIPWSRGGPDPALLEWLDRDAPALLRTGCRTIVPGCGLGDDARALLHRGYDVVGFDLSETAIEWAREIEPADARRFCVGDLFSPPSRWIHRFDLVTDCFCLQSLPPAVQPAGMAALANLLSPHGLLVLVGHVGDRPAREVDGPPWPIARGDAERMAKEAGLRTVSVDVALEGSRLRAVFSRA